MNNIENLNLDDLKSLLKQINKYRNLKKQLWNRWIELFNLKLNKKNILTVEYYNNMDLASTMALDVYKKTFNITPKIQEIKFIQKNDIKWWIKVFMNDSMVDISFSKIEKLLR